MYENKAASRGESTAGIVDAEVQELRRRLHKDFGTQALVQQTMLELLIAKGLITEDEFEEKLDEIDGRDGVLDGTLGGQSFARGGGI